VCRPDVESILKHASSLFAHKHAYFSNVLRSFQAGQLSSTDVIQEVIMGIKECVGKAKYLTKKDMGKDRGGDTSSSQNAVWLDSECRAVKNRFEQAWGRFRVAERESMLGEVVASLKSDFLGCRYDWQRCKRRKRRQYELEQQRELIRMFFSSQPGDFWKVFNRSDMHVCLLDDLEGCTSYFKSLLGSQVGDPEGNGVKGSWSPDPNATGQLDDADRNLLNEDLTREELCSTILACKNGKAADPEGMTAEALKLTVACQADSVLDCIAAVLDGCHQEIPHQLKVSKISPIPKCSNSGKDNSLHRGIAVGSIFAKVGEKSRYHRLSTVCERSRIRCLTQCGFRPEHGTLDAIFTLQHAVDQARYEGFCLICCLVDFEKAFDKVDRQLMLRRCQELGVEGRFLEALCAMYDEVKMVVSLKGQLGEPFDTYQGTRQGSELSPLLFGLFIEQLHYLLTERVPGAGPILGKMHIPDLMYADDVAMMAINSHAQMQGLLDALHLFCRLFGMKVNIKKTKIILFRPIGKPVPKDLTGKVWLYDGKPVTIVEEEKSMWELMNGEEGPLQMATRRAQA
jgi:hypothetical protein